MEEQVAPISRLENVGSPGKEGRGKLFWLILVVVLIAALAGGGVYLRSRQSGESEVEPTPEPTIEVTSTPTPTLTTTSTPTPKVSPTPTPKPKASPTPTPQVSVAPKNITVRVLNGSGVTGAGAKAADFLRSLGYEIASVGNAESEDYDKTTILAKNSQTLLSLQTDLATKYEIGTASATLSATDSADVVVTIGKQ